MKKRERQRSTFFDDVYDLASDFDISSLLEISDAIKSLAEISEPYTDYELIGRGAIKEVYCCYDQRTKRKIAYTKPRGDLGAEFMESFVHEAWLTSSLKHPNIIKVHEIGLDEEKRPFFTMELKSNWTLLDFVREETSLKQRLEVFDKICDAVSYAHSQDIVHLDLKPDNIQCDDFGEVVVCDWGLGKSLRSEREMGDHEHIFQSENMTLIGEIKGSLGYMAPEQAITEGDKGVRTDIFALGAILYFILYQAPPFTGAKEEVLKKTREANVSFPRHASTRVSNTLKAIITKAMSRNEADRYASVSDMQDDLERYITGYTVESERYNVLREVSLFIKRHTLVFALVTLFTTFLLGAVVLYQQQITQREKAIVAQMERSEKLSNAIEEMNYEHSTIEAFYAQGSDQAKALNLSQAGVQLLYQSLGIFDYQGVETPVTPLREAKVLFRRAHALDPESVLAVDHLTQIYCIMLDFKSLLELPRISDSPTINDYRSFAELFPDYNFADRTRPNSEDLEAFFLKAREISTNYRQLLESIMRFHYARKRVNEDYTKVVVALLKYVNQPINEEFEVYYNAPEAALTVSADIMLYARSSLAGRSLLSYLDLDVLKIVTPTSAFDATSFDRLKVKTLDLTEVQRIKVNLNAPPIQIENIETVILPQNQMRRDYLKTYFEGCGAYGKVNVIYR